MYVLWLIEELVDEGTDHWEPITRLDEHGEGSPLVWTSWLESFAWANEYEDDPRELSELRFVRLTSEGVLWQLTVI